MSDTPRDHRVEATEKIWKYGVAMLACSLPFVFLARLVMLPVYIVFFAGIASLAVWMFGGAVGRNDRTALAEKALKTRIDELEERLANVETLTRVEMQLLGKRQKTAAADAASPPQPQVGEEPVA